jgi:hypothetical protein
MRWIGLFLLVLFCQLAALLAPLRAIVALLMGDHNRVMEITRAYDKLGNAMFDGSSEEYISTRANRARIQKRKWGCVLCALLERFEKDHCANSAE